ncbi:MAG TPA: DUF1796 family putative cysteine peptidase [Stellaceae bacterium]|jgi:hypothetical protein|nr:DUF1796 family putative cysteine peptidase [Stellaceae bacterium]
MQFGRVISLGGVCQVSHQIERKYGAHPTSPFDWLVTPLGSIERILADDGTRFGQDVFVEETLAICKAYGVGYHHEFPRDSEQKPIVSSENRNVCGGKLSYKYSKFVQTLSDNMPTLFIRMLGHHNNPIAVPYIPDDDPVSNSDLRAESDQVRA